MACHNFPVTTPIMAGDLFPIRTVIAFRSDESPQLCFFEILPSRFQRQRRSLIFGSHMDLWMERHNNLMFFMPRNWVGIRWFLKSTLSFPKVETQAFVVMAMSVSVEYFPGQKVRHVVTLVVTTCCHSNQWCAVPAVKILFWNACPPCKSLVCSM